MESSANLFNKGFDKSFGTLPTINNDIMLDALKYKDMVEGEVEEKWSEKYKKSIDCKNPKGFSQKAHCQGRKKKSENKEATSSSGSGQFSAPFAFKDSEFVRKSFAETPKKVETKEATGSGSVGAYSTPAFVAPNKKEWRGAAKPLYKGGAFVKVKKKCKNFPYCNQGDIKALKIYENENLNEAIKNVSNKLGLNENVIKSILQYEYEKTKKLK
jgi:hypothetical protein